jgi:hypothetical protein
MPTREETEKFIQIKNNKASEYDIMAELNWKRNNICHTQINHYMTWITKEISQRWNTGILCSILEKGDKLEYGNYRGIALLNIAYKILSGVINIWLTMVNEEITGEYQCGFHPNRSTVDQLL